jgi:hypothetical protein
MSDPRIVIRSLVAQYEELAAYSDVLLNALTDIVATADMPEAAVRKAQKWTLLIKAGLDRVTATLETTKRVTEEETTR